MNAKGIDVEQRSRGPEDTPTQISEPEIGSVLGAEEMEAICQALTNRKRSLSWGGEVERFEREFAAYCGAVSGVAVSSCTAALDLCAQVLRLGPDDEIVATPQSFWSTIRAPVERGVRIRFADIDAGTLNIHPKSVEERITPRTKAIYLVHYGGNPADLGALRRIADGRGIPIVEDCAHAPGASHAGNRIGAGDLCCFSFQSYKNMTTLGEGGMITTNNPDFARRLRSLRNVGVTGKYEKRPVQRFGPHEKPDFNLMDHSFGSWDYDLFRLEEIGSNRRMAAIPAAVGSVQLRKLDDLNKARRWVAERYSSYLSHIPEVETLKTRPQDISSWHLYTCCLRDDVAVDRNELLKFLQDRCGIRVVQRYWPLHLNSVLRARGHELGECPTCESVWFRRQINLPIGPLFTEEMISKVAAGLAEGIEKCRL